MVYAKILILLRAGIMLMICLFAVIPPAQAHKVMAFAYVEGRQVHVEGYFADGKKLQDSLVEVFDSDGVKILDGKTNEEGVFSFHRPGEGRMKIALTGSMGHRAECFVEADQGVKPGNDADQIGTADGHHGGAKASTASSGEDLRAIVSQEMDKKLAPLLQEIRALKEDRPSVAEILGGIGYIIGIVGIIMYFKARHPKGIMK